MIPNVLIDTDVILDVFFGKGTALHKFQNRFDPIR